MDAPGRIVGLDVPVKSVVAGINSFSNVGYDSKDFNNGTSTQIFCDSTLQHGT